MTENICEFWKNRWFFFLKFFYFMDKEKKSTFKGRSKMKIRVVDSLIRAVAIVIMGCLIYSGFMKVSDRGRKVSVRGLAEKEVVADRVFWSVSFSEMGNDIPALYKTVAGKDSLVIKFFLDHGIPREDISVKAPDINDVLANPYRDSDKRPENRYTMTSAISIASSRVENVRKLQSEIGELAAQGFALNVGYADFVFTGLNSIKPQMIEEATKNARFAAEKFAKDSESELGKILEASQGQFSIDDRDANTSHIKKVRVVIYIDFAVEG